MLLEGSQSQKCPKRYQPAHGAGMNATLQQEDSIRQSLEQTQDALERSQDRYRTYADLQHQLKMLSSQEGKPQLRMEVDVGSGVMMQAEAHSPLKLLVDVGLGFHAECNIVEAQQIASLQEVAAQANTTAYAQRWRELQARLRNECRGVWTAEPRMQT